jgi:hypothetical protein
MDLSKDQRNEIFRAVAAGQLDPADCEMDHEKYPAGFTISHSSTGSSFSALAGDERYRYLLRVANDPLDLSWRRGNTWGTLLDAIRQWSHDVATWLDTPDLWALRHNWRSFVGSNDEEAANVPFTQEEQDFISSQLSAIRDFVKKTYELTAEQSKNIDEKFEEFKKDSKRLGRKDWKNVVIGGAFSLILTDVITPGVSLHILMLMEHGIGYLFTGGGLPVRGILSAGQD